MKPKSFTQPNNTKQVRVAKISTAAQAIGEIQKNTDTFILTYGQFSLVDALLAILDQTGPAHVTISTWTAAHAHLDTAANLMGTADILSFRMIVDRSFKTRQPKYYHHMARLFGSDCIRQIRTHAKFMTIRNDKYDIVVRTSMNLNENPRLENLEVSESKEFADFFETIADDIFREVAPDKQLSDLPKLDSIPESVMFPEIEAKYIKRSTLNEASYTHTINE